MGFLEILSHLITVTVRVAVIVTITVAVMAHYWL